MSRIFIIILVFFPFITLFSNTIEDEFKNRIDTRSSLTRTIQCDFNQSKKVRNITQVTQSKGTFYYDNSGLIAMCYSEPKGNKIIMNGDSFLFINSGKKIKTDARSNPMIGQISNMLQACMTGDVSRLGRGWEMNIERINNGYEVVLKPTDRRIKKYVLSMIMHFEASNMTLDVLRINEVSGGYTQYVFTNKVVNEKIDISFFTTK